MSRSTARKAEYKKYADAYKGVYGMGKARRLAAFAVIDSIEQTGNFLDVGCGRGEVLGYAKFKGFDPVCGVEVVEDLLSEIDEIKVVYGESHSLPFEDNTFDVVTCFDMIEHVLPQDTVLSLNELDRVSRHSVILSAANYPSWCNGIDLHINKRPYSEWDELIHSTIEGSVKWMPKTNRTHSETWVISKQEQTNGS